MKTRLASKKKWICTLGAGVVLSLAPDSFAQISAGATRTQVTRPAERSAPAPNQRNVVRRTGQGTVAPARPTAVQEQLQQMMMEEGRPIPDAVLNMSRPMQQVKHPVESRPAPPKKRGLLSRLRGDSDTPKATPKPKATPTPKQKSGGGLLGKIFGGRKTEEAAPAPVPPRQTAPVRNVTQTQRPARTEAQLPVAPPARTTPVQTVSRPAFKPPVQRLTSRPVGSGLTGGAALKGRPAVVVRNATPRSGNPISQGMIVGPKTSAGSAANRSDQVQAITVSHPKQTTPSIDRSQNPITAGSAIKARPQVQPAVVVKSETKVPATTASQITIQKVTQSDVRSGVAILKPVQDDSPAPVEQPADEIKTAMTPEVESPADIDTAIQPVDVAPVTTADGNEAPDQVAKAEKIEDPFSELELEVETPAQDSVAESETPSESEGVETADRQEEAADDDQNPELDEKQKKIAERRGLKGLKGFCPVALRDSRDLIDTDVKFSAVHDDKTYFFSTEEARETFEANPIAYAPVSRGNDIILEKGDKPEQGSLDHAVWFRDRLYLFANSETLMQFVAEPTRYVEGESVAETESDAQTPVDESAEADSSEDDSTTVEPSAEPASTPEASVDPDAVPVDDAPAESEPEMSSEPEATDAPAAVEAEPFPIEAESDTIPQPETDSTAAPAEFSPSEEPEALEVVAPQEPAEAAGPELTTPVEGTPTTTPPSLKEATEAAPKAEATPKRKVIVRPKRETAPEVQPEENPFAAEEAEKPAEPAGEKSTEDVETPVAPKIEEDGFQPFEEPAFGDDDEVLDLLTMRPVRRR